MRECCKRASEGYPPCEPCQYLMQSDAFSGVDARHDEQPKGRDPYEQMQEGFGHRDTEER